MTAKRIWVAATQNQGKLRELRQLFDPDQIEIKSLADFSGWHEVVEDQDSFFGNARKKAREIAKSLNMPVIADDSGLCVDALGGAPGVYSARFAGEHASDQDNNKKLLRKLADKELQMPELSAEPRYRLLSKASFVCALVSYEPGEDKWLEAEGRCEGYICATPHGDKGFGYDPLFYVPEYKRTMAELLPQEKNKISHRAKALAALMGKL